MMDNFITTINNYPKLFTYRIQSKLNKTTLVQISGERVPFNISTIKVGLKQCFIH